MSSRDKPGKVLCEEIKIIKPIVLNVMRRNDNRNQVSLLKQNTESVCNNLNLVGKFGLIG